MCLMLPAQVVSTEGDECVVESCGQRRTASTLMEPRVEPGDWVLVAGSTIVRRVAADQASAMARAVGIATGLATGVGPPSEGPPP